MNEHQKNRHDSYPDTDEGKLILSHIWISSYLKMSGIGDKFEICVSYFSGQAVKCMRNQITAPKVLAPNSRFYKFVWLI